MDRNQEITFQLLKEIDEICKQNDIKYYLHADTAAMALKNGGYVDNYISTAVEMTTQDAVRFMNIVEENPRADRILEHMGNYAGYAGFSMKYVNTDTLYIPFNYFDNYEHKGIGITIIFIRGSVKNKWKQKLWTLLELGIAQNTYFVVRKPEPREFIAKWIVKFIQLFWNKASMKKYFFTRWLKDYEYSGEGTAFLKKEFGERQEYPQRYFDETREVEFEGYKFPVIWDTTAQIRRWFGGNWKNKSKGTKPGRELLLDDRVSYEEFKQYLESQGVSIENIKTDHKAIKRKLLERKSLVNDKNTYWKYAWNVRKNYICDEIYAENKEYIYRLYKSGAYMELFWQLRYYHSVMKENEKFGYHRIGDKDIFDLYKMMLEMQKEKGLLKEVEKWEHADEQGAEKNSWNGNGAA